jgi:RNA polymerase subunit RPABC4/transcription elongation factor Spt4
MEKSMKKIRMITNIVIITLSALGVVAGLMVVMTGGMSEIAKDMVLSVTSAMAAIAIILILAFTVIQLASNVKQLIKTLIGLAVVVAVFLLCYVIAPTEMSDIAIKIGISESLYRWVGAMLYFGYIIFAGVIIALIGSLVYVKIKN